MNSFGTDESILMKSRCRRRDELIKAFVKTTLLEIARYLEYYSPLDFLVICVKTFMWELNSVVNRVKSYDYNVIKIAKSV